MQGHSEESTEGPPPAKGKPHNSDSTHPLPDKPVPGIMQKGDKPEHADFNDSSSRENVGSIKVGFGENAPKFIPSNAGMPKFDQNDQNKKEDFIKRSCDDPFKDSSSNKPEENLNQQHQPEISRGGEMPKAPHPEQNSPKQEINQEPPQQDNLSKDTKNEDKQAPEDTFAGLTEVQTANIGRKQNTPSAQSVYDKTLLAIYFLSRQKGSLALTKVQARQIADLIERAENAKDTENQAYEQLKAVLNDKQKYDVKKYLSSQMKHATGPIKSHDNILNTAIESLKESN